MKVQTSVRLVAMALGVVSAACSSGGSNGQPAAGGGSTVRSGGATGSGGATATGGTVSSGGAGGSGGAPATGGSTTTGGTGSGGATGSAGAGGACSDVVACGGDVVGTWTVVSSCLRRQGDVDVGAFGLGCPAGAVAGELQVSGTWTAKADGSYTDETITTGSERLVLEASCLNVSGTTTTCTKLGPSLQGGLGYASAPCAASSNGGCTCPATFNQTGSPGVVSLSISTSGNYKTAANVITMTEDGTQYGYCVSGNKMTWTPKGALPAVTGTIVFQKAGGGTDGAGGAGGAGGSSARGGSTGTGGATASGGVTGAGGVTSAGGKTGAGGTTAAGGTTGSGGATGTGGSTATKRGPCDIYEAAKTPCVGAFSTVRALYGAYGGNLYQVRKTSDRTTKDIPVLEPGGYANSKVQDDFCGTGACTISILYDQSAQGNHMPVSGVTFWLKNGGTETDAKAVKISAGGHPVYGVKSFPGKGNSYRNHKPKGTAVGDQAEAMYEVVDTKYFNAQCCNDFGNAETTGNPDGEATMEAIYFGNNTMFGSGGGNGPWLLADLEAGTFPNDKKEDSSVASITYPAFATLMLNGFSGNRYALKHGDAQKGTLFTQHDGPRPPRYSPMKKQGAIVLGAGGDGSFYSQGIFFEGAITIGCPDDKSVDEAIQANVVAAGYGK